MSLSTLEMLHADVLLPGPLFLRGLVERGRTAQGLPFLLLWHCPSSTELQVVCPLGP